jgi:hypothetical protein
MTSLQPLDTQSIQYSTSTLKRAERAFGVYPSSYRYWQRCDRKVFLASDRRTREVLNTITPNAPYRNWRSKVGYVVNQVGILRREVDGQGITDSFRLTPVRASFSRKMGNT